MTTDHVGRVGRARIPHAHRAVLCDRDQHRSVRAERQEKNLVGVTEQDTEWLARLCIPQANRPILASGGQEGTVRAVGDGTDSIRMTSRLLPVRQFAGLYIPDAYDAVLAHGHQARPVRAEDCVVYPFRVIRDPSNEGAGVPIPHEHFSHIHASVPAKRDREAAVFAGARWAYRHDGIPPWRAVQHAPAARAGIGDQIKTMHRRRDEVLIAGRLGWFPRIKGLIHNDGDAVVPGQCVLDMQGRSLVVKLRHADSLRIRFQVVPVEL